MKLNQATLRKVQAQWRAQHPDAPAPKLFRHVIEVDWFRKFTWPERLHILLGCNLNVLIRIPTLHKPGEHSPIVIGEVSDAQSPSDQAQKAMKAQVEALMPPDYIDPNISEEQQPETPQMSSQNVPRDTLALTDPAGQSRRTREALREAQAKRERKARAREDEEL